MRIPSSTRTLLCYRLFFASVYCLLHASSAPAICPRYAISVNSEFFASKFVFAGTVISENTEIDSDGFPTAWTYQVQVKKIYRGPRVEFLIIRSENDTGRYRMKEGKDYLLFAREFEGYLYISNCGSSALLYESKDALEGIEAVLKSGPYGEIEGRVEGRGRFDVSRIRMIARSGKRVFSTRTDADGWFHMRVPPGKYSLDAKYRSSVLLLTPYDLNEADPQGFVVHRGGCVHLEYDAR
jgi:hypothetical protein